MDLTIQISDEELPALQAKATVLWVSAEQYALRVLEQDSRPDWLWQSWDSAKETGVDQLSMDDRDRCVEEGPASKRGSSQVCSGFG